MDMSVVTGVIIPLLVVVALVAGAWALFEVVVFLRKAGKTIDSINGQVQPILADAQEMTNALKPAVAKIDPLVDSVSVTVDAANLEVMRLDAILENVDQITRTASNAADAVDTVANAPLNLVNTAADKIRAMFGSKDASDESRALGQAAEGALEQGVQVADDAACVGAVAQSTVASAQYEAPNPESAAVQDAPASQQPASQPQDQMQEKQNQYFTYGPMGE